MNVITSDTEDSYLLKALIPVYQKCGKLAGRAFFCAITNNSWKIEVRRLTSFRP